MDLHKRDTHKSSDVHLEEPNVNQTLNQRGVRMTSSVRVEKTMFRSFPHSRAFSHRSAYSSRFLATSASYFIS